jgi:hypothetical protein
MEERRLKVFVKRLLSRIYLLKMDEVMGGWRKLHNEALNNSYSLLNIIRVI